MNVKRTELMTMMAVAALAPPAFAETVSTGGHEV